MNEPVIEVNNLSKKYNLVHLERGYATLRDKIGGLLTHPIEVIKSFKNNQKEIFWALKDVSFSVEAGEIVGIIGGNGAGKSTLLKVLSRITPPSTGLIKITGKVASLLEVGTGFHPELTGRENIFLNGAILGMPKADIIKKFDEIVEFAGVAKFLDTPVKRYSSGMYVRLAFAVAAHMESDILFVDEVLAVGDAEFQKKCLGKIGEMVKDRKKTILLVSHNLPTIKALCHRSILLEGGKIVACGQTGDVIERYLEGKKDYKADKIILKHNENEDISLLSVKLSNEAGHETDSFKCDQKVVIDFSCQVGRPLSGLCGYLAIKDAYDTIIMESVSNDGPINPFNDLSQGQHNFRLSIPPRSLAPGYYNLCLNFFSGNLGDLIGMDIVCSFELMDETTLRGSGRNGFFSTILNWQEI